MRMSVPAYVCLGLAMVLVIISYVANPNARLLLTALPMLLVLWLVPVAFTEINRRHMASMDLRGIKLFKIKDVERLDPGTTVRIRGRVEAVSFKWMNRPHYRVSDGSGTVRVMMFTTPREDVKRGDRVEAVGSLRLLGRSKEKKIVGMKIHKLN